MKADFFDLSEEIDEWGRFRWLFLQLIKPRID